MPSTKSITNITEPSVGLDHALDRRHAHTGALGHQTDQRLVLDRLLQRRGWPHIADIAKTDGPVGAVEQVGVALVLPEDLDEEALALGIRRPRTGASPCRRRRASVADTTGKPPACERGDDVGGPGRRSGAPKATSSPVPTVAPTAKARTSCIGRTVPEISLASGNDDQRDPRRPLPATAEPSGDDDRDRHRAGQHERAGERSAGEPSALRRGWQRARQAVHGRRTARSLATRERPARRRAPGCRAGDSDGGARRRTARRRSRRPRRAGPGRPAGGRPAVLG